jgi:hypothetical protein
MSHDVGTVLVNTRQPVIAETPVHEGQRSIPRSKEAQNIEALVEEIFELLIQLQQKREARDSKSVKNLTEWVLATSKKIQDTYCTKATMFHMIASVAINAIGSVVAFKGGSREIVEGGFSMAAKTEEALYNNIFQLSYDSTRQGAKTHQDLYSSERGEQQQTAHSNQQMHDEIERKLSEFYSKLSQLVREMR